LADYPVYAAHRIVEDSTMDTRRFHRPSPAEAFAAFRWLGWVMLMMFVLVQTAQAAAGGNKPQVDATGPQTRALSQATAQFDPETHLVTVEAPAPVSSQTDVLFAAAYNRVVNWY
jgi:hypothetical protein